MEPTRRALLAAAGTATAGLSGCLGGVLTGGEAGDCDIPGSERVESLPTPVAGDPESDVVVQVFEDFACPHCATFNAQVYPDLRSNYVDPGKVRYEHHDFPIPVSQKWSWAAASAARGVQDEVDDAAFFEYATLLYRNQDSYSMDTVQSLAEEVGAPGCPVRGDAINETYRPVLEADRRRGNEMGVRGTPTVFVNGRQVGAGYDAIVSAVRSER
jgi:protein-disulfide isomerase